MLCPVCKTVDLVMADRLGVEIDYCPQCRGVWLDRGELDKIIERSLPQAASQGTAPQYASRDGHDDDHENHHQYGNNSQRKRSFWQELFD